MGRYLRADASHPQSEIAAITHSARMGGLINLDLTQENNVHRLLSDHKPDVIIHCAAMGNVDYAQLYPQYAYQMNVDMTERLVRLSLPYNPLFVFISTNAVYDGNNPRYTETDPQNPINIYGRSKRQAEEIVRTTTHNYLIIRPFMLFGQNYATGRANWYTILKDAFRAGRQLKLIDDVIWQPTSASYAGRAIWALIDKALKGKSYRSYNLSQGDDLSLYEFGMYFQSMWNNINGTCLDLIKPVSRSKFDTAAPRPINTSYDTTRLVEALGDPPTLEQSFVEMLGGSK